MVYKIVVQRNVKLIQTWWLLILIIAFDTKFCKTQSQLFLSANLTFNHYTIDDNNKYKLDSTISCLLGVLLQSTNKLIQTYFIFHFSQSFPNFMMIGTFRVHNTLISFFMFCMLAWEHVKFNEVVNFKWWSHIKFNEAKSHIHTHERMTVETSWLSVKYSGCPQSFLLSNTSDHLPSSYVSSPLSILNFVPRAIVPLSFISLFTIISHLIFAKAVLTCHLTLGWSSYIHFLNHYQSGFSNKTWSSHTLVMVPQDHSHLWGSKLLRMATKALL